MVPKKYYSRDMLEWLLTKYIPSKHGSIIIIFDKIYFQVHTIPEKYFPIQIPTLNKYENEKIYFESKHSEKIYSK